jgi:alpha-glucuronidase
MKSTQRTRTKVSVAFIVAALVGATVMPSSITAETGAAAWLRYSTLAPQAAKNYERLPPQIVRLGDSLVLKTAQQELLQGVAQMLGRTLRLQTATSPENAIVLGKLAEVQGFIPELPSPPDLRADGYWLKGTKIHGSQCLIITASTDRGILYGVFALLSRIARTESLADTDIAKLDITKLDEVQNPYAPIRWVNQWDNLDGRIERGYGGPSIFFADGSVRADLTRASQYARLLASIGINGCAINNVNAAPGVLEDSFIAQVSRIADVFRPWGVQLSLTVDLGSPKLIGGLDTFDPLDPRVADWWRKKVNEIYRRIPDFAGFVVKADSEGRLGPSTYGRSHADAANVIARALKPHGGVVFYRAFVYNHHLDWHDLKNDRAKAAYDNFHPLDGAFDDNAIVQIKNGPIDFQVREPASPLFAGLRRTNEAIELQITQEYTGQQRQLCFLVPMWKEVLDFDMHVGDLHIDTNAADANTTPVKALAAGRVFHRPIGGFVGVANVGLDATWLGSPLAMANLYGFGRLAWDPTLTAEQIIDEWTRLTFGSDPLVVKTITAMQLNSWQVYESYTGPLGAGTLTNILGNHYDPGPESSEENGWGQWHRADHTGIGMDRTVATGTGFIGQYPPAVQELYESLPRCPDNLLLFFHHVPYTYILHSGKTVIQHIYDSHYAGADRARDFVSQWKTLEGHVDNERYRDILARFDYQAAEAIVWRDAICNWIYKLSSVPDEKGRVGSR